MSQWIITKDKICDGDDTGTKGPRGHIDDAPMPFKFRMKDDDGEIYYYGKCSHGSSFAPLDNFGMPSAGCTSIEYRSEAGNWETL